MSDGVLPASSQLCGMVLNMQQHHTQQNAVVALLGAESGKVSWAANYSRTLREMPAWSVPGSTGVGTPLESRAKNKAILPGQRLKGGYNTPGKAAFEAAGNGKRFTEGRVSYADCIVPSA
jgi:hypothetical protein